MKKIPFLVISATLSAFAIGVISWEPRISKEVGWEFTLWSIFFLAFGALRMLALWVNRRFAGTKGFFSEFLAGSARGMPLFCSLLMVSTPLFVSITARASWWWPIHLVDILIGTAFSLAWFPIAWDDAKQEWKRVFG